MSQRPAFSASQNSPASDLQDPREHAIRILHTYPNNKWTGPADPAIRCASRLRQLGLDVLFATAELPFPGASQSVRKALWDARIPVISSLKIPKHTRLRALRHDVAEIRRLVVRDRLDIVHTHQLSDQFAVSMALSRNERRPVHVHTLYEPSLSGFGLRRRHAMRHTDGVVAPTRAVADTLVRRFGFDENRVLYQEPVVEPRSASGPDLRAAWGLDQSHFVVGITARVQPHRRFELLWDIARRVVDRMPNARIVLLGRGNDEDMRALVHEPVERLGLRGHVVLPGYQKGADYDAALRTLDAFVFLVPGSDGTCRAAREAMAQGLPVVTTTRGILPELVRPGADGVAPGTVHDDDAAAMAADLVRIGTDAAVRRSMGAAALTRTRTDMDPLCAARGLQAFYLRLAAMPRR